VIIKAINRKPLFIMELGRSLETWNWWQSLRCKYLTSKKLFPKLGVLCLLFWVYMEYLLLLFSRKFFYKIFLKKWLLFMEKGKNQMHKISKWVSKDLKKFSHMKTLLNFSKILMIWKKDYNKKMSLYRILKNKIKKICNK